MPTPEPEPEPEPERLFRVDIETTGIDPVTVRAATPLAAAVEAGVWDAGWEHEFQSCGYIWFEMEFEDTGCTVTELDDDGAEVAEHWVSIPAILDEVHPIEDPEDSEPDLEDY